MKSSQNFLTPDYQRHNQRRQEHLASLGLPIAGKTIKQPWHEEFPTALTNLYERNGESLSRSVFVASKTSLCNTELSTKLLNFQER